MVAQYTIAGRQVGSHVLAMLTLGTFAAGTAYFMGGEKKVKEQGPPINAGSKDEEAFIQEFLKNNGEEQKAKQ
ncbi:hypothetical protein BDR22DRAFT_893621 [Usnea florida]